MSTAYILEAWRRLPVGHRRWILVKAVAGGAAINAVVTAAVAWIGAMGQDSVSFWGTPLAQTSIFWNLIGTLFLLPFLTYVLTAAAIRRDVRGGSLAPLRPRAADRRSSAIGLRRGAAFGALTVLVLGPPLALLLLLAGPSELSRAQFIAYQTAFAVVLGFALSPALAVCGMAHPLHGATG